MKDWMWILLGLGGVAVVCMFFVLPKIQWRISAVQPQQYNNAEDWEVSRDNEGRLTGIRIHRDAKVS